MSAAATEAAAASGPVPAGSARAWVMAARPATLLVGLVPVIVGTSIAAGLGRLRPLPALAALLGAVFIQIGTNLANDVFDYEKGADTEERLGPVRVTQAGLLRPAQVRRGMAVSFFLALITGIYLTAVAGWPVVLIGLFSIASGIAYTGGPYPLGYNGLGDVFVFVFFGPVAVAGTVYVQTGAVPQVSLLAALPIGALATAVLVVNNVRDHETDVKAGKRTLVVRFGRVFGVAEYAAMMGIAYAVPAALAALRVTSPWVMLSWLSLPLALRLCSTVARERAGSVLNASLANTARLLLLHGLLLAAGLSR